MNGSHILRYTVVGTWRFVRLGTLASVFGTAIYAQTCPDFLILKQVDSNEWSVQIEGFSYVELRSVGECDIYSRCDFELRPRQSVWAEDMSPAEIEVNDVSVCSDIEKTTRVTGNPNYKLGNHDPIMSSEWRTRITYTIPRNTYENSGIIFDKLIYHLGNKEGDITPWHGMWHGPMVIMEPTGEVAIPPAGGLILTFPYEETSIRLH